MLQIVQRFCVVVSGLLIFSNIVFGQNKKPNIIFILTDDQRWDALGVMGNSILKTPNLDRLANEGILFQNAYVTTSICCVSRASILSGTYESKHNIHDFSTDMRAEILKESYPYLLKQAGYNLGFIGKYGVGSKPPKEMYNFWIDTEEGGKLQPDYIQTFANGRRLHDTDTLDNAIQTFLGEYGKNGPFCLSVSFKAPHEQDGNPPKYFVQPGYENMYNDVTIPYPSTASEAYWNKFPDFFRTDSNFARLRWKGLLGTPELYQQNMKNYYRLITGVDAAVGRMMQKLAALGIDNNTIVIFMGDNGMMLGEKNIEGKWYGYEASIRVPLIIYDPRTSDKIKNLKAQQIALNLDVAPSILALAGVPIPKGMQGINLMDVVQAKTPARNHFFYQHYFLGSPRIPKVEGVVTKNFKYMKFLEHNFEELYDIEHDPHELENLINKVNYQKKAVEMRKLFNQLSNKYGAKDMQSNKVDQNKARF